MPIGFKKIESAGDNASATPGMNNHHEAGKCCHGHGHFGKQILMTLVGVLIVYLTFYVGTLMRNNIKKYDTIGHADTMERMISVVGTAKITGSNDIAVTTIGFSNLNTDVAKAQTENKKVMDQVVADLKKQGIDAKDMQSNYSINPEYDYTQKGTTFKGYRVNNNVTVKIRDLNKISDILSLPGKYGANQVGGLSFTIDDTENLKSEARAKALLDAKKKSVQLAQMLGVQLGEVISYSDYENSPMPIYSSYAKVDGIGGGGGYGGPAEVASGSQDIVMNVSITYKILTPRW
ncbi:MAG: SIMPL domain-containing protein [Patescibacteria group bacterium]